MFFQTWSEFINMGGYGLYVWLAYGISALSLFVLAFLSYRAKGRVLAEIRREQQRQARLQAANQGEGL